MRPRDAAAWLRAGRLDGAFVSTDLVLEEDLGDLAQVPLGAARSVLVVASREDDGRSTAADLAGGVVATHLPQATARWFADEGIDVRVVTMGGALEGVCAAGMADAIVDLRETGRSLAENRLRTLAEIAPCEALFVHDGDADLDDLAVRIGAVLAARRHRYVMLHIDARPGRPTWPRCSPAWRRRPCCRWQVGTISWPSTSSPRSGTFWTRLQDLRALGATGIVALPPDALVDSPELDTSGNVPPATGVGL